MLSEQCRDSQQANTECWTELGAYPKLESVPYVQLRRWTIFFYFILLNLSTVDNTVDNIGTHHKIICNKQNEKIYNKHHLQFEKHQLQN